MWPDTSMALSTAAVQPVVGRVAEGAAGQLQPYSSSTQYRTEASLMRVHRPELSCGPTETEYHWKLAVMGPCAQGMALVVCCHGARWHCRIGQVWLLAHEVPWH